MKTTYTLILSGLLVIAMSGVYADFAGAAARDYCYIQARTRDMYVIVYEEDRRGNKEGEIWKGWIGKRQERLIEANTGLIRYHYSFSDKKALSGDVARLCIRGITIKAP